MAALGVPGMGIGRLGSPDVIIARKFRFEMSVIAPGGAVVPPSFVRLAGLPNISIEPTELNYLNEKTWISGKASWEPISVTYIDAAVSDMFPMFSWLASIYNFTNASRTMGSRASDYQGTAIIYLYDGCGQILQEWRLGNMWPESINFGDVDYASSDTVDIEMTMRYSNVVFISHCPGFIPVGTCSPCS
jgi:hypothetical protein